MPNQEHLAILEQDVKKWNEWRENCPEIAPNLTEADLMETNLSYATLTGANLSYANLNGAVYCRILDDNVLGRGRAALN